MRYQIKQGDKVVWRLGNFLAKGRVVDFYHQNSNIHITSSILAKNWNSSNRALLIELEDGRKVLKLESEVQVEG